METQVTKTTQGEVKTYPDLAPGTFYGLVHPKGEEYAEVAYRMAGVREIESPRPLWRGLEGDMTYEQAFQEIATALEPFLAETQFDAIKFINQTLDVARDIYALRFSNGDMEMLYHGLDHITWTLIHALRNYVGSVRMYNHNFSIDALKTIIAVASFHEVREWWSIGTNTATSNRMTTAMLEFLEKNAINLQRFERVLAVCDFTRRLADAVEFHLIDHRTALYIENARAGANHAELLAIEFLADIIRFADFMQCLDQGYLTEVEVYFHHPEYGLTSIKTLAGSVLLGLETFMYRPNVLKRFGWGDEHGLDWINIGPDGSFCIYCFQHNVFRAHHLRRMGAWYGKTSDNLFLTNLSEFIGRVQASSFRKTMKTEEAKRNSFNKA
ncbi:hypothetical protein JW766_01565 [Candidatus Dojkabacteria bacterium]|nr:hypothetical protein [Candidatus Dojkabacteria bacterium]